MPWDCGPPCGNRLLINGAKRPIQTGSNIGPALRGLGMGKDPTVSSPSYVVLGTPGYIRDPERFDEETTLKVLGANSGNLLFQYATTQIVNAPLVHVSQAETPYNEVSVLRGAKGLIFPAANHLRLGTDWSHLNNYLHNSKLPLIVLGLGAQSPKIGGEAETIAALKADPQIRRMVDILREQSVFVSVRGAFSQKVCAELGFDAVHPLGCPSAMINPDPGLGRMMADKLAAIAAGTTVPRIAMTAAAPFEIREDVEKVTLERKLFAWARASKGLYVQQSGGLTAMQSANGNWHAIPTNARKSIEKILAPDDEALNIWSFLAGSGRFYLGVAEWRADMSALDLVLGTRLHGNMAAIAAGTPGAIIAHDSRTDELGQTMHLPRLAMADALAAPDLVSAVKKITFDGAAFDRWRGQTARTLIDAFDKLGIPVSGHVRGLAK